MELHQVRYFLALCNEKNFTRAAKHCGVSQPSLSNAIRKLEQELGGKLFHRNSVNCPLSELGQEVRPHLAKLDQCVGDVRRHAANFLKAQEVSAAALEQSPLINGSTQQDGRILSRIPPVPILIALATKGSVMRAYHVIAVAAVVLVAIGAKAVFLTPTAEAVSRSIKSVSIDISQLHQNAKNFSKEKFQDLSVVFLSDD